MKRTETPHLHNTKHKLILLMSLLVFSFFILKGITLPYVGPNATNFTIYSLIAHNFNRFGYLETKFAPLISVTKEFPQNPEYFFHHPTLLSVIESQLFKLLGEQFWVGRLAVILFAFGSLILMYLIAKELLGTVYSVLSTAVMTLIPATTLFGKMIGQEPLVLFFVLLVSYAAIRFVKTGKKTYLLISFLGVLFGMLSDWPMLYFPLFLLPLFVRNKKTKHGLALFVFAGIVFAVLLVWISNIMSGFWDLQNAVSNRSFQNLMQIPYWPLKWLGVTFLRLFIYFNPLIILLSSIFLYQTFKQRKKLTDTHLLIIGLLGFGLFHIMLYTEASFTHPYLVYYLVPGISFAGAYVIYQLVKRKTYRLVIALFITSVSWLVTIDSWKTEQTKSNLWRYEFASKIAEQIPRYETILINKHYAIDTDLLWYPFSVDWEVESGINKKRFAAFDHYVYTCQGLCNQTISDFAYLKQHFDFISITVPQAEGFIFDLTKERKEDASENEMSKQVKEGSSKNQDDARSMYRKLKELLSVPQI